MVLFPLFNALGGCASILPERADAPPIAPVIPVVVDATGAPVFDGPIVFVTFVAPVYPLDLRAAEIEGHTTIELIVGPDGAVESTSVIAASDPAFAQAATDAVTHWRFKPITVHGQPVRVHFLQPIPFRLRD